MILNSYKLKNVQKLLNQKLHLGLVVDGDIGPASRSAILSITAIPSRWPINRQCIAVIQWAANLSGIEAGPVDGYWGPQTAEAYDDLDRWDWTGKKPEAWRTEEGRNAISTEWPRQTTQALMDYYGPVGQNQVKILAPYPLRIAWNLAHVTQHITCHEKVADAVQRILEGVKKTYGSRITELGLDLYGGCLNVRKMRGGSSWSTHSWGIAFDFDPANNRLNWKNGQAHFSKPIYRAWFDLWEEQGATSLGRTKNYDWMHTQFANVG